MANDLTTSNGSLEANDSEYVRLVSLISDVWEKAKYDTMGRYLSYRWTIAKE